MRVTLPLVNAIIQREKPVGWGLRFSKHRSAVLSGETSMDDTGLKLIRIPAPWAKGADLRHTLFIFFHERYHAETWFSPEPAQHVDEYAAERFAIASMHAYGIGVRRKDLELAKGRIRQYIKRDERKGIKIDPRIRRWARS